MKGRIDKHIYCGYPDNLEREEILRIYTKAYSEIPMDFKKLSELTEGFSGADISALTKTIQIKAIHEIMDQKNAGNISEKPQLNINEELVIQTINEIRKNIDPLIKQKTNQLYNDFMTKGVDVNKQKQTLY